MSFTLQVTPTAAAEAPETHVFAREVVVIGRDASVDLRLDDATRIVSNRHAEVRQTAGTLSLVDLGSKNGTVLNGRRLRSGEAAPLREDDAFEVGDFEIRVVRIEAVDEVGARSETRAVHGAEREGAAPADSDPVGEADEEALQSARREAGDADRLDAPLMAPPVQKGEDSDVVDSRSEGPLSSQEAPSPDPETHALDGPSEEISPSEDQMLDALVVAVARLTGIPWQFRYEFIGQTIAPTEDVAVFAKGTPEALRRFLIDPRLDPDEQAGRRAALAAAAEAGALHQVAMLDGYKAGIEAGTRHLLEAFDPNAALADVRQGGFWQRLPLVRDIAALKRLRQTHRNLAQEDEAVAERGRFRPAFIKAYLARMTRRTDKPDNESSSVPS